MVDSAGKRRLLLECHRTNIVVFGGEGGNETADSQCHEMQLSLRKMMLRSADEAAGRIK